jgi:hypothetical protein
VLAAQRLSRFLSYLLRHRHREFPLYSSALFRAEIVPPQFLSLKQQ